MSANLQAVSYAAYPYVTHCLCFIDAGQRVTAVTP